MNNGKSTRRAFLSSVVALLLCVTMLMGTTFAWFTDTAKVNVNTIQSGTLKIDLVSETSGKSVKGTGENKLETLGFVKADGSAITGTILWEPGCTYLLEPVKLVNTGNLHAKYLVTISAANGANDGDIDLAEVIDVYEGETKLGTLRDIINNGKSLKEGVIAPGEENALKFGQIKLVMQTTANNDYQNKSITDIAVTVYATQATVEHDSEKNTYDEGAKYDIPEPDPYEGYAVVNVASQEELDAAVAAATEPTVLALADGTYTFYNDSYGNKQLVFKGTDNVVIDATGLGNEVYGDEFTFDNVTMNFPATDHKGITHTNKVVFNNCTLTGTQTLYAPSVTFNSCTFEVSGDNYAVWTYGIENAVFNNCTFNTSGKAILCYHDGGAVNANVILTNCVFNSDNTIENKAAVEVGSDNGLQNYNIVFTNCKTNGFVGNPKGTPTNTPLWGNKNSIEPTLLNVIIDGIDVY